jgi:hypothetical protein
MIKIQLEVPYFDISELKYRHKNGILRLIILFKNGDKLTLTGDYAKNIFDKLNRNKAGEQLE